MKQRAFQRKSLLLRGWAAMIEKIEVYRDRGVAAGKQAVYSCPYTSGQAIYGWWADGFVIQCHRQQKIPENTPMYLVGRIAYLDGADCTALPSGENFSGRWFSGWLTQKELTS